MKWNEFFPYAVTLTISNDNKWIITVINYATNWSIAKVIKNVKIEIIVEFLHEKIFQHYETSKKLLFNNKTNFLKNVINYYLRIFVIKHRNTILYYSKINEKIEILNETFNNILIKYLTNKSTKLWNEILFQILFVIKVKIHETLKYNSFFLYDKDSILFFDDNLLNLSKLRIRQKNTKHV